MLESVIFELSGDENGGVDPKTSALALIATDLWAILGPQELNRIKTADISIKSAQKDGFVVLKKPKITFFKFRKKMFFFGDKAVLKNPR